MVHIRISLQSFSEYLRQTLAFMRNSTLRINLISVFHGIFASAGGIFNLGGGLSIGQ